MGRSAHYKSPSSKNRNLRRLNRHLKKRLLACPRPTNLMITRMPRIDIAPVIKVLSIEKTSSHSILSQPKTKTLSFSSPTSCNILPSLPKPNYHPHIIEACRLMYSKHPDDLTPEECEHFRGYRQYKIDKGEPIETDFVYKPSDS